MRNLWNAFITDESGQGLVEYIILIALIAVGMIVALGLFRDDIATLFGETISEINTVGPDSSAGEAAYTGAST
jgi:Flp pilus assembly pilin Flp